MNFPKKYSAKNQGCTNPWTRYATNDLPHITQKHPQNIKLINDVNYFRHHKLPHTVDEHVVTFAHAGSRLVLSSDWEFLPSTLSPNFSHTPQEKEKIIVEHFRDLFNIFFFHMPLWKWERKKK